MSPRRAAMTLFRTKLRPADLFTRRTPTSFGGRVLQFPLVRMVVLALFLVVPLVARNLVVIYGVERLTTPRFEVALDLLEVVFLVVLLQCYRQYTRRVEGREAAEFSFGGAASEFSGGVGLAAVLVGATFAVLLATGSYAATGFNSPWILPHAFMLFFMGALLQVIAFRLLLYRFTEEWLGTWVALFFTSGMFSVAHLANPNMTMAGFLGLLTGDVILFAAFALTRRVWLVWGLHFGWNFLQDGILGMPNSGITRLPSFVQAEISGPEWLTGGPVGIEASVFTSVLSILVGVWMVWLVVRNGQTVAPAWRGFREDSRLTPGD